MMKFDSSNTETFTVDGTEFQFNTDRVQYIAEEQIDHYETRVKQLAKSLKRKKNKEQLSNDIVALYQEWNVKDNDEILYLLFSEENEDIFTDVTTENDLYANPEDPIA